MRTPYNMVALVVQALVGVCRRCWRCWCLFALVGAVSARWPRSRSLAPVDTGAPSKVERRCVSRLMRPPPAHQLNPARTESSTFAHSHLRKIFFSFTHSYFRWLRGADFPFLLCNSPLCPHKNFYFPSPLTTVQVPCLLVG